MLAYFARPIDQAREVSYLEDLTTVLLKKLAETGVGTFSPHTAYTANVSNRDQALKLDELNLLTAYRCDALVAVLPAGVATLGTPVEIASSLQMNKPTVVFTTIRGSVQLLAWEEAGATVVDLNQVDVEDLNAGWFWEALTKVPNPEEPNLDDVLQVSGEAANLVPGKYEGDAGLDLATAAQVHLDPADYVLAPTGVHVAIPYGYFGLITGRSSTWAKHRVDVRQAVIDSGYRGELMVGLENRGTHGVTFATGTRLAQLVLLPTWGGQVQQVEKLTEAHRGLNGYGSSGA